MTDCVMAADKGHIQPCLPATTTGGINSGTLTPPRAALPGRLQSQPATPKSASAHTNTPAHCGLSSAQPYAGHSTPGFNLPNMYGASLGHDVFSVSKDSCAHYLPFVVLL